MKRVLPWAIVLLMTVAFAGCLTQETAPESSPEGTPDEPTANETAQLPPLEANQVAFGIEGMS